MASNKHQEVPSEEEDSQSIPSLSPALAAASGALDATTVVTKSSSSVSVRSVIAAESSVRYDIYIYIYVVCALLLLLLQPEL